MTTRLAHSRRSQFLILLLLGLSFTCSCPSWATSLAWDANPPTEQVTGYVVHWTADLGSGVYPSSQDVGNVTAWDIDHLTAPLRFAVTAYNSVGPSGYSDAILWEAAPPTLPAPACCGALAWEQKPMSDTVIASDGFSSWDTGNWTQLNSGWGSITAASGVAYSPNQGPSGPCARWTGSGTFTDDQFSRADLASTPSWLSADYWQGVIVRASADTGNNRDMYEARVLNDSGSPHTTELNKIVNGTRTNLASADIAWVATDQIELRAEGTTIEVWRNGSLAHANLSVTDSALSSGAPGLALAGSTSQDVDDWEGGNIGAGSAVAPTSVISGPLVGPFGGPL